MNKSIDNTQNMLENIADNYFEAELKGDFDFLKFYKKGQLLLLVTMLEVDCLGII